MAILMIGETLQCLFWLRPCFEELKKVPFLEPLVTKVWCMDDLVFQFSFTEVHFIPLYGNIINQTIGDAMSTS